MKDFELYYYRAISALEKEKSKRSLWERSVLGHKFLRRKLEKGYISGVNSAIKVLKKVKKEFDEANEEKIVEHKERTCL